MSEGYVKQHIVPKCYLNRFAFIKNGKNIICTRHSNNEGLKLFTNSTDNVGYVKNIYDVPDKDDSKYWEHFINKEFDSLCGSPLSNIIAAITLSNFKYTLSENDKMILSRIIASQILREPENIARASALIEQDLNSYKKKYLAEVPIEERKIIQGRINSLQLSKQRRKGLYFNQVFSERFFGEFCDLLKNNIWLVFYNTVDSVLPFVTSDNPVLVTDLVGPKIGLFDVKMNSPHTGIYFPLTSKILIANYNIDNPFFRLLQQDNGKISKLSTKELGFILNINTKIVDQCFQQAYLTKDIYDEMKKKKLI